VPVISDERFRFGGAVWGHIVDTARDPAFAAAFAKGWLVRIMAFSFEGERPAEGTSSSSIDSSSK
jgi:hypothetical protein